MGTQWLDLPRFEAANFMIPVAGSVLLQFHTAVMSAVAVLWQAMFWEMYSHVSCCVHCASFPGGSSGSLHFKYT